MAWLEVNGLILLRGGFLRRALTPAHAACDRLCEVFSTVDSLRLHLKVWFSH